MMGQKGVKYEAVLAAVVDYVVLLVEEEVLEYLLLLLNGGDGESTNVGLVVLLHGHGPLAEKLVRGSVALAAGVSPLPLNARHGHRRQQPLALAEQQNALGNFLRSLVDHVSNIVNAEELGLLLVHERVKLPHSGAVGALRSGQEQSVDLQVLLELSGNVLPVEEGVDVELQVLRINGRSQLRLVVKNGLLAVLQDLLVVF